MPAVDPFVIACAIAKHLFGVVGYVAAGYGAYLLVYRRAAGMWWLVPTMVLCVFLSSAFERNVSNTALPYSVRMENFRDMFTFSLIWQAVLVAVFILIARRLRKKEKEAV